MHKQNVKKADKTAEIEARYRPVTKVTQAKRYQNGGYNFGLVAECFARHLQKPLVMSSP